MWIILFTIFGMGGSCVPLLKLMDIAYDTKKQRGALGVLMTA